MAVSTRAERDVKNSDDYDEEDERGGEVEKAALADIGADGGGFDAILIEERLGRSRGKSGDGERRSRGGRRADGSRRLKFGPAWGNRFAIATGRGGDFAIEPGEVLLNEGALATKLGEAVGHWPKSVAARRKLKVES